MNVEGFGSGETKTERLILIKNLHCLKLQFDHLQKSDTIYIIRLFIVIHNSLHESAV